MTAPFFFHGLLLLVGLCCPLPITKTSYLYEELYEDPSIDHFQCRKVVLTICNVSITLFKEMAQRSGNGNILFSPIRVIAALSMLSLGAKGNLSKHILEALRLNKTGLPEAEIHKCFRYLLRALHKPEEFSPLKSGSSVFIHQGLTPENKFVEGVKDLYHSDVISINFTDSSRAKTQINNYMMEKSKKEIGDIVKNLESDTFLAVVNYIILNAKIISNYGCRFLKVKDYHLGYGMATKVPTIHTVDLNHLFRVEDLSSTVLVYSLLAGSFTTYFILPDIGKMKKVEQRLTYPHFRRMRRQLSLRMVDLETPELSLSETHDLESVMSLLGITYAFNGVTNSDSSSVMNDTLPKSLKVISKAMLTHEDKWSKPGKSICFKNDGSVDVGHVQFNRPFLIFIQDTKNDAPLFLGRVVNPKN
ncbi:alpha-1-antitrypsin 1-6-like isoform X1 [Arvicanthis niloticus]|uniref:alpha-1-antitrypsin 1-6-like isoform X1 n=1 Tax=Arvicanthis niloticus TaxID=61156 RepID=UPI001485F6B6|nr:alpha-1-antitrypsin 1-6-like isoform X1 [Arvicanthis niloticus]